MEKITQINVNGRNIINNTGPMSIVFNDDGMSINGQPFEEFDPNKIDDKVINITIVGDVEKLEIGHCNKVEVNGNTNNIKTTSGNVGVTGDVNGNIQTMSGNVNCGNVGGNVSTMSGDITHK